MSPRVTWRLINHQKVVELRVPNGAKMVLRFDDEQKSFKTLDWDGSAATGVLKYF